MATMLAGAKTPRKDDFGRAEREASLAGSEARKRAGIARRQQRRLLELFGTLEWDHGYDYKKERSRK
jgi:hypothetical protein